MRKMWTEILDYQLLQKNPDYSATLVFYIFFILWLLQYTLDVDTINSTIETIEYESWTASYDLTNIFRKIDINTRILLINWSNSSWTA